MLTAQQPYPVQLADAYMKRNPDSIRVSETKAARWGYDQGILLKALERVWVTTGDARYFNYIKKEADLYVKADGRITGYVYDHFNVDNIPSGRLLLMLYQVSLPQKEKYKEAADLLWTQVNNQFSSQDGGYPGGGTLPFSAEYSRIFDRPEYLDRIFEQIDQIEKIHKTRGHFKDPAVGGYAMALVDVLDYVPADHPKREHLISYLQRLAPEIVHYQERRSGLWDAPESDISCMWVYTLAKAAGRGYIPAKYLENARKGYNGIRKAIRGKESTLSVAYTGTLILAGLEMEAADERQVLKPGTVALDYYFNREFRKDLNGNTEQFHYTWEDRMHSGFWIWGQVFQDLGARTIAIKEAPSAENLKDAQAYIIVDPDTPKETAEPNYIGAEHIKTIREWVENGGTLVLLANDTSNCEIPRFNELAGAFGIRFTHKNINYIPGGKDFELAAVNIEPGNEIFKNTRKVYAKEIVTLEVSEPARALVKKGEDIVMAVSAVGKGRVFVIGDPWLYNEYVDGRIIGPEYQNMQALRDLSHWILK